MLAVLNHENKCSKNTLQHDGWAKIVEKEDKWTDEDRVVGRSCLVIDEIGGLDF